MPEMTFAEMRAEAKTQGFEPIPIGPYNFRVESAELKAGKGGQQISTKIVVMDGPLAGRSTFNRLVPIKNDGDVNGMFYRQMAALGVADDHPVWAQIDAVGLDQGIGSLADLTIGAMFIGEISHQEWNGEIRDNVKSMKAYGSGGAVPTGVPTGAIGVPPGVPTAPVAPTTAPMVDLAPLAPASVPAPVTAPVAAPVPVPTAPAAVTQATIPEPVPAAVAPPVPDAIAPPLAVVPEPTESEPEPEPVAAVPPSPPAPTAVPVPPITPPDNAPF